MTKTPTGLPLHQRIIWARKRKGISQERLAEMVGTTRRHMIRVEKGYTKRPGPDLLARIADVTEQPLELFSDDEDEESEAVDPLSLDAVLELRIQSALRQAGVRS